MEQEEVTISVKYIDDRKVVEVLGRQIVLNSILSKVENEISQNTDVEEVRFIAGTIFTINVNLDKEVWRERNIVVYAKEIMVSQPIHWNVSGKDCCHTYEQNAGTGEDGTGLNGKDGKSGGSGGNVMILTKSIKCSENLTISANGGNGSTGQDGGNGKTGEDGKGISISDFDSLFPLPSIFFVPMGFLETTYTSLLSKSHTIEVGWALKYIPLLTHTIEDIDAFKFILKTKNPINYDLFLKSRTEEGHRITYSCYYGFGYQIFLLYEGTAGQPGKPGGQFGLGGEGGKPGEVNIVCSEGNRHVAAKVVTKSGADGINGKGGVHGRNGKRGWDMGYLYYDYGRIFGPGDWPKYYGRDKNSSLKINFYSSTADDRVRCSYKKEAGYPFAGITQSKIENKNITTLEERNNSRSDKGHEHEAKVVGKKTISRQRILNTYSTFMNAVEAEIEAEQKKRAYEEEQAAQMEKQRRTEQAAKKRAFEEQLAAQEAAEIERQIQIEQAAKKTAFEEQLAAQQAAEKEMQLADGLKEYILGRLFVEPDINVQRSAAECCEDVEEIQNNVTLQQNAETLAENHQSSQQNCEEVDLASFAPNRHVPFLPGSEHKHEKVKITMGKHNTDEAFDKHDDYSNLDDWLRLNKSVIECKRLKQLMDRFHFDKGHLVDETSEETTTKIKAVEKMFIGKYKLATLHALTTTPQIHQEMKPIDTNKIKNLSKYLMHTKEKNNMIEHRILGTMKQYLFENTQKMRNNLASFVTKEMMIDNLELNRAVKTFVLETKYTDLYKKRLENLQNELKKPQHNHIYRLWDGLDDRPLVDEVKEMIENDITLKILYDQWYEVKLSALQYESDELSVDEHEKTKFIAYIQSEGVMSESCRELLAYVYDTNLRVYGRDEDHKLILCEDHNPSSDTKNYILLSGNEFGQLTVNEEYLQLGKERLQKDKMYAKILSDLDVLKSIEDISNYLEKSVLPEGSVKVDDDHFDEKSATEMIANFFREEERQQLQTKLEKVAYEYSKQNGILRHMLRRFTYEGTHTSFEEMCFFINAVLGHFVDDDQEQYTFAWIVAAYNQRNWLDEVILLQLETYFKKKLNNKQKWRNYLGNIKKKEVKIVFAIELKDSVCSIECVDEILLLLSSFPIESMLLGGIPLTEWCYFLKEYYWIFKLRNLSTWSKDETLNDATYYVRSVENMFGESKTNDLLDVIKGKENDINETLMLDILLNLHKQKWKLSEDDICILKRCSLQDWAAKMKEKYKPILEELKIVQLAEIIENDKISSDEISKHLPKIRTSIQKISDKKISHNQSIVALFTELQIKTWVKEFRDKMNNKTVERHLYTYEEMLAVIDRAIEIKRGFRLRDTQRLSVLMLLANDRSTLAQVSTGEGKSLIVVTVSLMKALLREKVDVVTSSPVLARRDSEVNVDIYGMFDINVSHNCSDDIEERKEAYSMHQVVYGDLANFQRDYLLDRFYGKNILGDRNFTNVIVDEVDSMLLDKGNNMLYLSHDIPGMDKLESVYISIWQMVNSLAERPEDVDTKMVEKEVMRNLYNSIDREDLKQLDIGLNSKKLSIIWNCLVNAGIINDKGEIITDTIDSTKLDDILTAEIIQYKHRLSFLLKKCVNREKHIKVPNYLKKFVERHLSCWVRSAINALLMEPGQSYVVDYKKSGSKADRNASIIILDSDTGADQGSSQWNEALHQFLQLKHGCKLSMQSLKAVFVSNVTYFKQYKLLYGLTGTLGSERERNLLKDIYQVAFVTIPTAKPKQFEEYEPIISDGNKMWRKNIKTQVCKLINEENRSVLIICDTIKNAESINNALKGMFPNQLYTYTRDYQVFDIVKGCKQLQQGEIIIATNLAGRGTDIRITDGLRQSGGLHVILTYLPENIRIEEQAFGRAARSGDKGSGQLIIMVSSQRQHLRSKIIELKKIRDNNELYRISDIKTYYEKTIKAEEICFDEFKQVYESHRKSLEMSNVPSEIKTILLQNCLDQWSFWLDEHSPYMEDMMQECDERGVPTLVKQFVSKLSGFQTGKVVNGEIQFSYFKSKQWRAWVEGNPMQMVKLANYLSQTKLKKCRMTEDELLNDAYNRFEHNMENGVTHYSIFNYGMLHADETAISLYDDVIKTEPQFSEAAHYYRAYTVMKSIEFEETLQSKGNEDIYKDFKKHLREAMILFEDRHAFALQAAIIANSLKGNNLWHDEYQTQKETIAQLYQTFIRSIEDIFGHAVTHNTFVKDEINENVAEHIFMQLIEKGVISRPKVQKTISEEQLRMIHSYYGISIEALKKFLSERVGLIVEEEFINACKEKIPLPSREEFWQLLIAGKVLNSIKKYAIVDNAKLEAIDPSLKDALDRKIADKTLITQSIEPAPGQIVLYREELSSLGTETNDSETKSVSVVILEKENFISLIGKEKFEMMVRKNVISCNEMANVDRNMIASCKFSSFDSISVEDIVSRASIAKDEAEVIIKELVNRKVLKQKGECFVLNENFSRVERTFLPSYPLYEDTMIDLVSSCFAYRIALNQINEQLEADSSTDKQMLRIELKCNPHLQFFQDLINQNIIIPFIVEKADCKEILNEIFYLNNNYVAVKRWFQKMLHISKPDSERFLNDVYRFPSYLDKFNWIDYLNLNHCNALENEICPFIKTLFFVRNNISEISFIPTNQANEMMQYEMRKTIKQFFVQLDQFFKKETKSHVESVLGQIKSSLLGLTVSGIYFKPIQEVGKLLEKNFGTIEEEQLFTLNGLQHLLQVMEKKWSSRMLLSVGSVVIIGVAQIVAGAIIEIYSAGAMTHVASAIINEGVNDLMYAVNSFNSGYFSWQDYGTEKIKSVIFTGISARVASYASRGIKLSPIAYKVAGPELLKNGKAISELTGNAMRKLIIDKRVMREVGKRIVMKTAQGFAQSAASIMVDKFTDVHLQALINSSVADILSNFPTTVDSHKISQNLRRIYDELGEQQARRLILQLSAFGSNDWEACISLAKQFTSSLSQGFASAMQKTQKNEKMMKLLSNFSTTNGKIMCALATSETASPFCTIKKKNGKMMKLLSNFGTIWEWVERAIYLGKMRNVVGTFLDNLDEQFNKKLATLAQCSSSNAQPNECSFEQFRDEIMKEWKSQISEHVGKIISQHLVKPLLNDVLFRVRRFIKRIPHNIKRIVLKCQMKSLKKKHCKAVKAANVTDELKDSLTKDYHNKLKKIMCKTKSPSLLSNIIEEGVPMDLTCAAASAPLVHEFLKKMKINVKGIVLTVQGEEGIEQTFYSGITKGENVREIVLQLKDNHFTFSDTQLDVGNNDCMFAAINDAVPELSSMGPDEFRKQIANTIRHDPQIQHRIRQGWHRFPIKQFDAIGGKSLKIMCREISPNRAIENEHIASLLNKFEGYTPPKNCPDAINPHAHLFSRMTIYSFELAGAIQAINEELKTEFKELIVLGKAASTTKDDLPVIRGGDIHRAHTLRGQIIETGKLKEHSNILNALQHYMARCEYVAKEANQYRNIPKYIDDNQMPSVSSIADSHDFSKPPTDNNYSITKTHLEKEITNLEKQLTENKPRYEKKSLHLGNTLLTNLSNSVKSRNDLKLIYEAGQFGYNSMRSIIEKTRKASKDRSDLNRKQ